MFLAGAPLDLVSSQQHAICLLHANYGVTGSCFDWVNFEELLYNSQGLNQEYKNAFCVHVIEDFADKNSAYIPMKAVGALAYGGHVTDGRMDGRTDRQTDVGIEML